MIMESRASRRGQWTDLQEGMTILQMRLEKNPVEALYGFKIYSEQ